jgi:hypothetical protein
MGVSKEFFKPGSTDLGQTQTPPLGGGAAGQSDTSAVAGVAAVR